MTPPSSAINYPRLGAIQFAHASFPPPLVFALLRGSFATLVSLSLTYSIICTSCTLLPLPWAIVNVERKCLSYCITNPILVWENPTFPKYLLLTVLCFFYDELKMLTTDTLRRASLVWYANKVHSNTSPSCLAHNSLHKIVPRNLWATIILIRLCFPISQSCSSCHTWTRL